MLGAGEIKRVFLIVMDSFGIGEMPDAWLYKDQGSNTLRSIVASDKYSTPNLESLGLFNIDGVDFKKSHPSPKANFARMAESSAGKDTIIGHWEIAGIISKSPLPTFPEGFPEEFLQEYSKRVGRGILCNQPYSGTKVIADYGQDHIKTGDLIVYTSADSVFQVAGHEEVLGLDELYRCSQLARDMLVGEELGVGRVIARPFTGQYPNFTRTSNRRDYSLAPPRKTILDYLMEAGLETISVGKISDIFSGRSISRSYPSLNNADGMEKVLDLMEKDFKGLCFVNLVDFDMLYGHRNDVDGYAGAASEFDRDLERLMSKMEAEDLVIITADHGCDPKTPSTDHSREYVPMLAYSQSIKAGVNLGTRKTFADIGATILEIFGLDGDIAGQSFFKDISIN
nr:phosphopentomutase [Treponema phagedenis]